MKYNIIGQTFLNNHIVPWGQLLGFSGIHHPHDV